MLYQRFTTQTCGDVLVSEYINYRNVIIIFVNTGHITKTSRKVLTQSHRPRILDPLAPTVFGKGCIGIGRHIAHDHGDTVPFRIWRAMLRRCYYSSRYNAKREGQSVVKEWLNFQTFADWYEAHHPADGSAYQLDKDIRVPGNKVYGPTFCMFVTQLQNLGARSWAHT